MSAARAVALAALVLLAAGCGRRTGMVQNKGSDTMINLAHALAEEYRRVNPEVAIAVSGGGSGVGIASLENGTVDIANASREMKAGEKEKVLKRTGHAPVEYLVGYDALAVYIHPRNPLPQINREQLICIFAEDGPCRKWTDIGVKVPGCSGQQIVRIGRQNNSGTFSFFREWVVGNKRDFRLGSRDMSGSKDVVDLIEHTPCAIGYSGIGYATRGVKPVCLAAAAEPCVAPSTATALDGTYPLSRPLYMITGGDAGAEVIAYLAWVRSDAGQAVVERTGYAPLPRDKRNTVQ